MVINVLQPVRKISPKIDRVKNTDSTNKTQCAKYNEAPQKGKQVPQGDGGVTEDALQQS